MIGEPQVDLGLAAPGDTVEERDSELTRVGERRELLECLGLLRCQHSVGGRLRAGRGCTLERVALGGLVPRSTTSPRAARRPRTSAVIPRSRRSESGSPAAARRERLERLALLRGQPRLSEPESRDQIPMR